MIDLNRISLEYARKLAASQPRCDYTINQLPTLSSPIGTDLIPIFHNGETFGVEVGNVLSSNQGVGPVTAPAVPTSTVAQSNTFGVPMTVYVTGGTVTVIAVAGIAGNFVATGSVAGAIRVPTGGAIKLTYSVPPTWAWFGD